MSKPPNALPFAVLDNSAALALLLPDERHTDYALALSRRLTDFAWIAPALWQYEFSNAIRMALLRKRIHQDEVTIIFADLQDIDLHVQNVAENPRRLLACAIEHGVTAYDASYLLLALEQKIALATNDKQLKAAAINAGITII
jgi:predicted nucleic acid-binding protein